MPGPLGLPLTPTHPLPIPRPEGVESTGLVVATGASPMQGSPRSLQGMPFIARSCTVPRAFKQGLGSGGLEDVASPLSLLNARPLAWRLPEGEGTAGRNGRDVRRAPRTMSLSPASLRIGVILGAPPFGICYPGVNNYIPHWSAGDAGPPGLRRWSAIACSCPPTGR